MGSCARPRSDAVAQRRWQRGGRGRVVVIGLRGRGAGARARSPIGRCLMPIVTVSRQYGSGGSEVAGRVARALGWQLYDNEVIDEVAARLGVTAAEVSAREER